MAMTECTPDQLQAAVDALARCGGNKAKAALQLGIPRPTLQNRLIRAQEAGYVAKVAEATSVPIEVELRSKVRQLQSQIDTYHRETLSDRYIREKILGLAAETPKPPNWLVPHRFAKSAPGVPTLFASDWHWGEVVDPSQINHVNNYNLKLAQDRARTLIETTIDLLTNHVVNPNYPGIVFALGGDMVSGDIHEELTATNEAEMMPVVLDLWGVLVWCITTLADRLGRVFVPCVSGNHARTTKKMRAKGRNFTSFDWLLYCFLEKHFEADKRVQFLIPNGPDAYYRVYNHRYLLTHGDQFRGGDGMIGALGPIIRGDHKKRSRNGQIDLEYDTLVLGHWHQLMMLQRLICNGSLIGYNEYANDNNFPYEPPRQALWLTHPEHGITISMPVLVQRRKSDVKPDWISWAA